MAYIQVLFLLVSITFFLLVFYGPWQTLCVDWARQRMFEARDRVFDLAMQGHISFHSKEYKCIRSTIERMIRFCHVMTWQRLVLYETMDPNAAINDDEKASLTIVECMDGIGSEYAKREIGEALHLVAYAIIVCITGRSLILAPIGAIVRCLSFVNDGLSRWLLRAVDRDSQSAEFGVIPILAKVRR